MKIIYFFGIFVNSLLACDPINVYTNIFPNKITQTSYINRGIRIGFISQTPCKYAMVFLSKDNQDNKEYERKQVQFQLVSINVSKFVTDESYMIYYSYQALIEMDVVKSFDFTNFNYKIGYAREIGDERQFKEFKFSSNFNLDETRPFKFAVLGNLKKDYINKFIEVWQERQIDCLILLGNIQEDWYKEGGKQFDEYFQMLQPITSKIPFYFLKGFYEKAGDFNGPLNNRFIQTFIGNQLDNYFSSLQYGNLRLNFFTLNVLKFIPNRDIVMNHLKKLLHSKDYTANQIAIFSNYSLNCLNSNKEEVCSQENAVAIKPLELFLSSIRVRTLISAGYPLYQYFQMKTFQTGYNFLSNYWDAQQYNPTNYIVGTGGNNQDHMPDKDKNYVDGKMNITNLVNELGYLEINFLEPSLEKFSTKLVTFQKDGQIKFKDERDSKYNSFFNNMGSGIRYRLELKLNQENQQLVKDKVEQFESFSDQEEYSSDIDKNTLIPAEDQRTIDQIVDEQDQDKLEQNKTIEKNENQQTFDKFSDPLMGKNLKKIKIQIIFL